MDVVELVVHVRMVRYVRHYRIYAKRSQQTVKLYVIQMNLSVVRMVVAGSVASVMALSAILQHICVRLGVCNSVQARYVEMMVVTGSVGHVGTVFYVRKEHV